MKAESQAPAKTQKSSISLLLIGSSLAMVGLMTGVRLAPFWEDSSSFSEHPQALEGVPTSSLSIEPMTDESSESLPGKRPHDHQGMIPDTAKHSDFKAVSDVRDFFGYAQLVQSLRSRTNSQGRFLKVEIYNTDFKYPLIRVAEQWDETRGLSARSAMVADHLLVRWKDEAAAEEIAQFLIQQEAEIRDLDADSRIAIISFDGLDPRSLVRMLKTFKESPLVESVDPDYLTTNH